MNRIKETVLVTGGTGFVGIHCILQLLEQGFSVKTTLRSAGRKDEIIKALQLAGISSPENLSFIEADLTNDQNWDIAVQNCEYVLHVASPFPAKEPENENELIIPARDGALRVLKAARDAGVKRVVLTSSFAAIGYGAGRKDHVFTEKDWTDPNAPVPAYIKSKTLAEKAAWEFIEREGGGLELTVINPVGIFGPAAGGISSASIDTVVKGILNGVAKESPNFTFGVVDVRDVARIHLLAMTHPEAAGERFLATSDGVMSFADVAGLIKKERPAFSDKMAEMNSTESQYYIRMSNMKAQTLLDWHPRTKEEAILASVDSLVN